ncbi:MAG TPA: DotU family type IV/VI secretion system protein [Pyrinomonadaceae bacterium]|nr:DotU family type IV/VI secretion system protein [Pyrinomonadaceae bacterium]
MGEYDDPFRLAPFREFYAEIIRLKLLASAGAWVSPSAGARSNAQPDVAPNQTGTWVYYPDAFSETGSDDATRITTQVLTPRGNGSTALVRIEPGGNSPASPLDVPALPQPSDSFRVGAVVWHRLVTLFQRQEINAWKMGGVYGAAAYKESKYVMVALADDIFLHMEWEGQRDWVANLLEAHVFGSHSAGQVFFENLELLLREQNPNHIDLAKVYLMALSLGFKGKYYGMDDRGKLARYRQLLFNFIYGREPDLDDETRYVFPEAYYHNVREESQRKLSDPRKWIVLLCLVLAVYTAATQVFWMKLTQELNTVNQSITKIIGELKAQP